MKVSNMRDNEHIVDKDIQAALSKLVADEWFAGHIYQQFVLLVKPEQREQVQQQFTDTADDELADHLASLV